MVDTQTLYILLIAGYPIISAILLFNHLKFQKHAKEKTPRRRKTQEVLHHQQGRSTSVKQNNNLEKSEQK